MSRPAGSKDHQRARFRSWQPPVVNGGRLLLFAFLLGALAVLWNVGAKPWPAQGQINQLAEQRYNARSWLGRTPPDIEVQLLGGKRFQLSDQIGRRPILVSFFATWCQPCKEELKELKHFAKRHPDSRLMVLLIDADEKRDLVRAYLSKEAVPFPAGIDSGGAIGKRYRISAVPTSVFIGLDGRISLYQQGAILNADVVLAPLLEQQQGMLRRHQQISKAEYLRRLAAEEKFHPRVKNRSGIVLTEAQKAFAQKLICPVENVPVLEGKCPACKALRRKLAKIKVEGLTDTQIFQKLYMKNEGGNRAQSR